VRSFDEDQVTFANIEHDGRALYRVALASGERPGTVRVSARRHAARATETWIADELNRQVGRFGHQIVDAALQRPLELE
jgi:hypothetical protein